MSEEAINIDVKARYELCERCLTDGYLPGGAPCVRVIKARIEQAGPKTKWLNPYYIEKHAGLEQPLKDTICSHCKFREEHEMREFVSNL